MKTPFLRSLLFGCLAMMAAVFSVASPAAASDVIYANADAYDEAFLTTSVAIAYVAPDTAPVSVRSVAQIGPVHPVYHLSWRTSGHSLRIDPHLRV